MLAKEIANCWSAPLSVLRCLVVGFGIASLTQMPTMIAAEPPVPAQAAAVRSLQAQNATAPTPAPRPFLDLTPKPLPRLQPGIVIGNHAQQGYSDLVTLVRPRLHSGAIDSLPDYSKRYASLFNFALLADVQTHSVNSQTTCTLGDVGVGFAMELDGKMIVVTRDTANQYGANLGMIDRGVLGGNEDCLEDIIQIARTETMMVFDAKANMVVGNNHEDRLLRHFLWASPKSRKAECIVFQLKENTASSHAVDCESMQWLSHAFEEDRKIHVSKGGRFSVIPTPARFALETLPQGKSIPFSANMRSIAGKTQMTSADLQKFANSIGESVLATKRR